MIGCGRNGHVLDWTSSDFHTSENGSRICQLAVLDHNEHTEMVIQSTTENTGSKTESGMLPL